MGQAQAAQEIRIPEVGVYNKEMNWNSSVWFFFFLVCFLLLTKKCIEGTNESPGRKETGANDKLQI